MVKRFLIIQTAFIGDVILATPVISELKRIFPNALIDILVRKGNESIIKNDPNINLIFTFNKLEGKLSSIFKLIMLFRKNNYDEIINLHRFASSGLICVLSGSKSKIGFDKNPLSLFYTKKIVHKIQKGIHEVERNLKTIQHHGAVSFKRPEVFPSDNDRKSVEKYQKEIYYCLAPASVWFTKQLPEKKWIELGKKLSKTGNVYLVGGKLDVDICERIKEKINHSNCKNSAGLFTFMESAALFQSAKMNYVNDSGPLHFCSAMNAPVTAFFCSTTPDFGFGPVSDQSEIIETKEILNCKPCGIHGHKSCPKLHFKCGNGIEI